MGVDQQYVDGKEFVRRIDLKLREVNSRRQDLAEYCGITAQAISEWSRKGRIPSARTALKIAEYLHVSYDWLFTINESEKGWHKMGVDQQFVDGKEFVRRVDLKLREVNTNRQALAEYCGITAQSFSDWTRRGNLPTIDKAIKIAEFLHVSIGWLLKYNESKERTGECDEEYVNIITSSQAIMYRIDAAIREKNNSPIYYGNEEFYKGILDIINIGEIESMKKNQYEPGLKKLYLLAERLGLSISWIISGTNETNEVEKSYVFKLANDYSDLLQKYACLPEKQRAFIDSTARGLAQTRSDWREILLAKGIDISDMAELDTGEQL